MRIIGKHSFVIEIKVPKAFSNKVIDSDEGPVMVPDAPTEYEYMWFCGIGAHPDNPMVIGAIWSPYPEQAHKYSDIDDALMVNRDVLGKDAGSYVIDWEFCNKHLGRSVIIPIPNSNIELNKDLYHGKDSH